MSREHLPHFKFIDIENFALKLGQLLQNNLDAIQTILAENPSFNWDNLMHPLEEMDDALERFWSPLSHMHSVVNSKALRECYETCLPKLSAYEASVGHNEALYKAIQSVDQTALNTAQKKIMEDSLRGFELSGVALIPAKKQRLEAIQTQLSQLCNQFENNVSDAEHAFSLHITDEQRLAGIPEHAMLTARELAAEKNLPGWMFNLEFPSYVAVVTYAEDRDLRETLYKAYVTRASEEGPQAKQFDNTQLMSQIMALRHEKAQLLGFANYAEYSLATKMAESPNQVRHFLQDLAQQSKQQAQTEFQCLQDFAEKKYNLNPLAPWDLAFLSEKKSHALYAISQEELRPYFSLNKVMSGLFAIVKKLYGMQFEPVLDVDTWHKDVSCYCLRDESKEIRGYVYMDLFARPHKRGGAWMDSMQSRYKLSTGEVQLPISTLTCNFAKPSANKKAALSHDEVITLFHELGHCLHHILTKVDYLSASGINGVEWDAVELPSQFFENWCWEQEALSLLTEHVETGESLPESEFKKLLAAKNFQSAMAMMRQLEFSLFDFRIHQEFEEGNEHIIPEILAEVRKETLVVPLAAYNRFQNSFLHIFSGGYAAGYYSYKWAEVLSSDAFSRFEEEGIFNEKTGRDFLHQILEVGGSKKAAEAYQAFRGRPAEIHALLRHNGIHS